MTTDELDRLEALAFRATPGPWVAQSGDDGRSEPWYIDTHAYPEGPEPVWAPPQYPVDTANAAFIAACDPDTIRRLIAAAREPLDVEGLRSPRNSLGKLALPKGLMEIAVEEAMDKAQSPIGDPEDGIVMTDLSVLADAICDALAAALRKPVPA